MKNITLSLAALLLFTASVSAKRKHKNDSPAQSTVVATPPTSALPGTPNQAVTAPIVNFDDFAKFDNIEHSFGNVPEGPQAKTDFIVKNINKKEPLLITNVQASCGCTVPSWTKEAIAPGKTGVISAIYNTQGRPGNIHKTLTVTSNHGTKQLTLSGNVEKAPTTSVPANEGSILKH